MAQYRGTVQGNREQASRLGTKSSGLQVHADGWNIGASVYITWNEELQRDEVSVRITGGSNGHISGQCLGVYYLENGEVKKK